MSYTPRNRNERAGEEPRSTARWFDERAEEAQRLAQMRIGFYDRSSTNGK